MQIFCTNVPCDGGRCRRGACVLLVLCLAMPVMSASSQSSGRHPDRQFVDQSIPVTTTVRLSGPRVATPLALGNAALATIGVEDGPEQLMFGEIASAAVNSRGQVVVVDRKTEDVRLFDAQGKFLQRLGKKGQGPGEFRSPHTVLVMPNDEIWIVDMQRRISVFAPSADRYKLARTIPIVTGIRSMCLLGSSLIVNGVVMGNPHSVHVLDAQARPQLSFGRLYSSPNEGVNWQFTEGRVICAAANDLVILATTASLGEVRAYRLDGRPVWRVAMDGVKTNIISDIDRGYSVIGSPDGAHTLLSLNLIPGVGAVVQYSFRTAAQIAAKEPGADIQTVVIDPRTGAAVLSSTMLPRLGAVSGNRIIAFFEDPAPRLEIRELRRP